MSSTNEKLLLSDTLLLRPLNDKQADNLKKLEGNTLFAGIKTALVQRYGECALMGGLAVVVESEDTLEKITRGPFDQEVVDLQKSGDIDFVVEHIGEVDQLVNLLRVSLPQGVEVQKAEGKYTRVDIFVEGQEVASVGDLGESAGKIRKIKEALGKDTNNNDWMEFFGAQGLKNFQSPIVFDHNGAKILDFGNNQFNKTIEVNSETIYTLENYTQLIESGNNEMAEKMFNGYGYWIGKTAMLMALNFDWYGANLDEEISRDMERTSDMVQRCPKARAYLSDNIQKAVGISYQWTRNAVFRLNLMEWYCPNLAKEIKQKTEENWSGLNETMAKKDYQMSRAYSETGGRLLKPSFGDFINRYMETIGVNKRDMRKYKKELKAKWNPRRSLKTMAGWEGYRN